MIKIGKWIVTSAWPYAHGVPHLGNLIGSLLSADIFTRYLRIKGEDAILVSGSDEHGTPIEVKALQMGRDPKDLTDEIHSKIVNMLEGFNIKFDNYTRTHNDVHIKFVQDFYMKIFENGHIFKKKDKMLYCEHDKLFLPDRFVVGTCPYCGYEHARGDQCENCGKLLTPLELVEPKCIVCGEKPVVRETTHFYFDLPAFEERLRKMISESETLTENAKNFSLNMIKEGLRPRSITRNNKWGIPAPFPGAEDLTIYVWFEAVLGYVSAVKEYFIKKEGDPEKWKEWWFDKDTNVAFFIGKDNIPFHTIIFPALLMATGDPYTFKFYIGATEYLNFEGKKFSKTHKIGIWCDEALKLLPPDYWRYTLVYLRPETRDSSFTWESLDYAVNEELNNHFGNLVQRLLTLIKKYYDGRLQKADVKTSDQEEVIETLNEVSEKVDRFYMDMRFQKVLPEVMRLVKRANALINKERPWEKAREDPDQARSTLYTIYRAVKAATIMLYPIIPESSIKILGYLGENGGKVSWNAMYEEPEEVVIDPGFKPPFNRINIEEIKNKLRLLRGDVMERVDIGYLSKIDMRIGTVEKVEKKVGSKKILRITVDIGNRKIKVLAGLAPYYKPEELVGKKVVVITNMKPKKIIDETSDAMLLAAIDDKGRVRLLTPDGDIDNGAKVG